MSLLTLKYLKMNLNESHTTSNFLKKQLRMHFPSLVVGGTRVISSRKSLALAPASCLQAIVVDNRSCFLSSNDNACKQKVIKI